MISSNVYAFTILTVLVCGAGGTLLYKWHQSRRAGKSYKTKFRVNRVTGSCLIGRNRVVQSEIERKSNASFTIKDDGQEEVLCVITATSQADLDNCKCLIQKMLKDEVERLSELGPFTEKFVISLSAYKKIKAQPNSMISALCVEENVKIEIETPRDGSNLVGIRISGDQRQGVVNAKEKIQAKVKEIDELERSLDESSAKRTRRLPPIASSISSEVVLPEREKLEPAGADGTLEVYVSALTSPHRFWMQILGPQAAALDNLVETMTEYYNKEENRELHAIIGPQVGQIVAAMFNVDGKWYRAQVQEIKPNDYVPCQPVLDLYFVDYGDNCYAAPNEVFELRPDFLTLRFQAIECFLANVSPPWWP